MVGLVLGQILSRRGQRDEGLEILRRSHAGFLRLGQTQMAGQTQALIAMIEAT
jgi:hypothetical protein